MCRALVGGGLWSWLDYKLHVPPSTDDAVSAISQCMQLRILVYIHIRTYLHVSMLQNHHQLRILVQACCRAIILSMGSSHLIDCALDDVGVNIAVGHTAISMLQYNHPEHWIRLTSSTVPWMALESISSMLKYHCQVWCSSIIKHAAVLQSRVLVSPHPLCLGWRWSQCCG